MTRKLHIVADENIPALDELLGDCAVISRLPGRSLKAADLCDADALLVRSVTRVDASLLAGTPVKFVGTCTIGTDHVDEVWLADHDIAFASAPGCNAPAVVDYVMACLFFVTGSLPLLQQKTVGVVGYGQVGSKLVQRLARLGIPVKVCDPFRPEATATLQEILACDIISLHVPYTVAGEQATHHLLDAARLRQLRPGCLLVNTSRGAVVDNRALLPLLQARRIHAVLDVYEDEPAPSLELLDALEVATAHIAGYSLHGKIRGTMMVMEKLFSCFGIDRALPDLLAAQVCGLQAVSNDPGLIIRQAYDVKADSRAFIDLLRSSHDEAGRARLFDDYRKHYPVRYEWSFVTVSGEGVPLDVIGKLGFCKK